MLIHLSPCRTDLALTAIVAGDVLTLNGVDYDFGPLQEGATLPNAAVSCLFLLSDVTRVGGQIELTLMLPHGPIPWPAPPEAEAVTHPQPITITHGRVPLPSYTIPEPPADIEEIAE